MVEPPKARGGQRGLLLPIPLKSTRCTVSRAPGERVHLDGPNYNAFDVNRRLASQTIRVSDGNSSPDVVQYHAGHLHVTRRNFDNHVIADHGVVSLKSANEPREFHRSLPSQLRNGLRVRMQYFSQDIRIANPAMAVGTINRSTKTLSLTPLPLQAWPLFPVRRFPWRSLENPR